MVALAAARAGISYGHADWESDSRGHPARRFHGRAIAHIVHRGDLEEGAPMARSGRCGWAAFAPVVAAAGGAAARPVELRLARRRR